MRELVYSRKKTRHNRSKIICLHEYAKDKDCDTRVHKNFVYLATPVKKGHETEQHPQVFIKKSFNSQTLEEKFSFRVRGAFTIHRGRQVFRVDFCHVLRIEIVWKNKDLSPKQSGLLT